MSTATSISVEQYLRTSYRPDREYVEGEVRERKLGEFDHATLQAALVIWFGNHQREWGIRVVPEQRIQVSPNRFRVPDIAVLPGSYSKDPIVRVPPLIRIEVLSKDDTLREPRERVNDHLRFGVEHVWVFDPALREAFRADQAGYHAPADGEFLVAGTPIRLVAQQLFAALD